MASDGGDKGNILKICELTREMDEKVLEAAFISFGPLLSVEIPRDYHSQISKGFGFVKYENPEDAEEALFNMHEAEVCGQVLQVVRSKGYRPDIGSNKPIWAESDHWLPNAASNQQ